MRASTALKLLPACCGFLMSGMPAADATKAIFDYRTGEDFDSDNNCVDSENLKTRYLQIEAFDYNQTPNLEVTWRQITDECGNTISDGFESTMSWAEGDIPDTRLQMDMYICAPWGNYELIINCKSTNGGNAMERIAWEVEYGPDEYHIYDTLNTPFFDEEPASAYAPIPNGEGTGEEFKFPLEGSEAYYSVMYSGPFPPLQCSNLYPDGVDYVGCFDAGLFGTADEPTGSANSADPAENYRMFDGIDDAGVDEDGVMTLEKCASICNAQGTTYFGLESAIKCLCGNELDDSLYPDVQGSSVCGIDWTFGGDLPEYKFLCSGDSRVLCGTDDHISVYSLDGSGPAPTPEPDTGSPGTGDSFTSLGCVADSKSSRVMEIGPIAEATMSAEICLGICQDEDPTTTHFGTQYANECWCTSDLGATTSSSSDLGATTPSSACTMSCANTDGEICGGFDALSVYEIDTVEPTLAPVTIPSVEGYVTVGCSADDKNDRVMEIGPLPASPMAASICHAMCLELDPTYTHFGTEFGSECFCSADLGELTDSTACTFPCEDNAGEICGGNDAISVYEIVDVTPVDDYTSLGCFPDPRDDSRSMEQKNSAAEMSIEICYNLCVSQDAGYTYFGMQYGVECWCSTTFSEPTADGVCDFECAGNPSETCGGFDNISAYAIN